ncbi:hypothetical protein, partial [Salmonella enterica]
MKSIAIATALALLMPCAALAQKQDQSADKANQEEAKKKEGNLDKAGKIATQPARDVGLDKE